jgi:hypothetical protein
MNNTTTITRSEEAVSAEVDGTAVMMSVSSGKYFGLDEISTRIWELLEAPKQFGELCNTLQEEYEVDEATCKADLTDLLAELEAEKLISVSA